MTGHYTRSSDDGLAVLAPVPNSMYSAPEPCVMRDGVCGNWDWEGCQPQETQASPSFPCGQKQALTHCRRRADSALLATVINTSSLVRRVLPYLHHTAHHREVASSASSLGFQCLCGAKHRASRERATGAADPHGTHPVIHRSTPKTCSSFRQQAQHTVATPEEVHGPCWTTHGAALLLAVAAGSS